MKKVFFLFLAIQFPVWTSMASGTGKPAYKLYTSAGKYIDYQKMMRSLLDAKIDIPFIATNVPRRYASLVSKEGFGGLEKLSDEAKELIAPLPVEYDPELPGYKGMLEMHHPGMHSDKMLNFPKAQALKDATMAYFILQNLNNEGVMLHFNGTYHTQNYEGILWYIQQLSEVQNIKTIATVEQENIKALNGEYHGIADFILVVPKTMTKTH